MLFVKEKETTYIPKIYLEPDFNEDEVVLCNKLILNNCDLDDSSYLQGRADIYDNGKYIGEGFYPGNIDLTDPADANKEYKTKKVDINDISEDVYGKIKDSGKTSSVQIFEMAPLDFLTDRFQWNNYKLYNEKTKDCEEVRICTEKGGNGNCISYTPGGKAYTQSGDILAKEYNSIILPIPYFVPVNIPKKLKGIMKLAGEDGDEYKLENKKFADKIKSIIIRGDCLVVLFENRLEELEVDPISHELSGAWEGDTPGSHSETFLKSDWDLTDNEIARCGSARGIFFGEPNGCASAIAVFPIRIFE